VSKRSEFTISRIVLALSFLTSIILSLVLLIIGRGLPQVLLALILVAVSSWFVMAYLFKLGKEIRWFFSLAVINLVIIVPELALRVIDFQYEPGVLYANLRPEVYSGFVPDKELLWKLPRSKPGVNSLGFPGKEIVTPKAKKVFRILFLGDSCTEQDYARLVEKILNDRLVPDATRYEAIRLAVSGYSSYQGRVMAEKYNQELEPDLSVVWFGWNDHWFAYRVTDEKAAISRFEHIVNLACHYSRLLQLGRKSSTVLGRVKPDTILDVVRVPTDQYRENLIRIKRIFEKEGVPVIYVTAPTSHYRLGVPNYLVEKKLASDEQSAIQMHMQYNQIVRDVAASHDAYVLDLEAEFNLLDKPYKIFTKDGIHFTPDGLRLVAERMCRFFKENNLTPYDTGHSDTKPLPVRVKAT
jgi:lysophospholipase L1-like esterase